MSAVTKHLELTLALDGARVLYRHFLSPRPPVEGWVREFAPDGRLVRISKTSKATDAGVWHRVYDLRCEALLEPAKAPATKEEADA